MAEIRDFLFHVYFIPGEIYINEIHILRVSINLEVLKTSCTINNISFAMQNPRRIFFIFSRALQSETLVGRFETILLICCLLLTVNCGKFGKITGILDVVNVLWAKRPLYFFKRLFLRLKYA